MGNRFIADIIQDATGVTAKAANEASGAVVEAIVKTLKKDGRLNVPGFGTFVVSRRAARKGRNPATGESIKIKASKSVRFKASLTLRRMI